MVNKRRYGRSFFQIALAVLATSAMADLHGRRADISERAQGADQVIVGSVARIEPVMKKNKFGDQLIFSRTVFKVEETLKGTPAPEVLVEFEGGTLNGVTLRVSDIPQLRVHDRAVLFLKQEVPGVHTPHLRGDGVLLLDAQNRVKEETLLRLEDIRRQVKAATPNGTKEP